MALKFQIGEIAHFLIYRLPRSGIGKTRVFCTRKKEGKIVIGSTPLRI